MRTSISHGGAMFECNANNRCRGNVLNVSLKREPAENLNANELPTLRPSIVGRRNKIFETESRYLRLANEPRDISAMARSSTSVIRKCSNRLSLMSLNAGWQREERRQPAEGGWLARIILRRNDSWKKQQIRKWNRWETFESQLEWLKR